MGSGKTALVRALCYHLRNKLNIAVITNDIYTREDADFLLRHEALEPNRIVGVETGGCPHTAIREDASINLNAVDELNERFDDLDMIIIESGGDNLAARLAQNSQISPFMLSMSLLEIRFREKVDQG